MFVFELAPSQTDLEFLAEFVKIEEPRRLNNCLNSLNKLTWTDLRFVSNHCNNYNLDAPYLLQKLTDKGVHYEGVSRPEKIQFLRNLYSEIS